MVWTDSAEGSRRKLPGALVFLLFLTACSSGSGPAGQELLLRIDREFSRTVQEKGAEGWAGFFAEDGTMFRNGAPPVMGREAILQAMTPFFAEPGNSLQWEPESAQMAASGDLGFTVGRYRVHSSNPAGESSEASGHYVTIWEKQPDQEWKVVVDIGNPDGR